MISLILNIIGAGAAILATSRAAGKLHGMLRIMYMAGLTLSIIYFVSFLWLSRNMDRVGPWSEFMRNFGPLTWLIVWCAQPIILVYYLETKAEEITKLGEKKAKGL